VEESETGRVAGFSELFITHSRPETLEQGLTAVFPEYRNRGLGRWLKAAMVEKVLDELPEAREIRTGNADVNEPMLNINREMGFRPMESNAVWQTLIERVERYLAERGVAVGEAATF
jgi:GNAT superfamily N-acetyltransferase